MSNRFHSKYHRKNHHTYGNATNPEASHDPIASPDQPFLGDFSLQGALCAVAPASAYAGYFYSNNTALCAIAGNRGLYVRGLNPNSVGIESFSLNIPLSTAYGRNLLHGQVGINKNTITTGYVLDVLGDTNLDGNLNVVGDVDIDGGDLTASTPSFNLLNTTTTTINFGGAATNIEIGSTGATSTVNINGTEESTSCTTGALVVDGGVGIAKNLNTCGTVAFNGTTESTSCTTGTLVVAGGVGIAKNLNVCGDAKIAGNLTVDGTWTYLDTKVQVTSAVEVYNMGTGPALKVTQSGSNPIAHFIDSNGGDIVFADDGKVGIGIDNPATRLDIYDISNGTDATWHGGTDFVKLFANTGSAFSEQDIAFQETGTNIGAKIGVKNTANGAYDIIFANRKNDSTTSTITEKMRITNDGNVGIGTIAPPVYINYTTLAIYDTAGGALTLGRSGGSRSEWGDTETETYFKIVEVGSRRLWFGTNNVERLTILPGGNVGIGINSPSEKLTVIGRVSATGFRSDQGAPASVNSSTNGYSFGSDGDTGLFSPIVIGGADNGIVSLFSNGIEQLRANGGVVNIYGSLVTDGNLTVGGTITNDPKAPITTDAAIYNVSQSDHDKTILAGHATTTISIALPTGLKQGTQVSVIRTKAGIVQFTAGTGTPTLKTTPTSSFTKLAFENSAASAYWSGTEWYLVGDLLT